MDCNIITHNTKLMTVREFASEYGIGVNKSYEIVHKKGFPKVKIGRKILIIRDKVDDFFINKIGEEF